MRRRIGVSVDSLLHGVSSTYFAPVLPAFLRTCLVDVRARLSPCRRRAGGANGSWRRPGRLGLAIDPGHRELRLFLDRDLDPLGYRKLDGVRVAQREAHVRPGELGAVADALDLEAPCVNPFVTPTTALLRSARVSPWSARCGFESSRRFDQDLPVGDVRVDAARQLLRERALGAL